MYYNQETVPSSHLNQISTSELNWTEGDIDDEALSYQRCRDIKYVPLRVTVQCITCTVMINVAGQTELHFATTSNNVAFLLSCIAS